MSKPISNVGIPAPNNSQGQSGGGQNNSNPGIDSLPSLVLARIFEFAAADQEGFETTGAIRSTSREFRRANDEVLLPELYYNIKTALRNHPLFQSLPEFQRIINANSDQMKSVKLFKDLSSAIHARCLLFPEQYLRSYQEIEDHSLVMVWDRLREQINFHEDEAVPNQPQEIRDWINNPENVQRIQAITELHLDSMNLRLLPREIGAFVNLEELTLSGNHLNFLPETIGNLKNLITLDLENNHLQTLPESFGNLQHLIWLSLSRNQLRSLPESFGNLQQLINLNLANNHLESLPMTFGNLQQLKNLGLHANQLESLPDSFGNLPQLTNLNLGNNQLKSLPDTFGNLQRLTQLFLNDNQLERLPDTFGSLQRLRELYLTDNQLYCLPETFRNLQQLQKLMIFNNLCLFMLDKKLSMPHRRFQSDGALQRYRACHSYAPTTPFGRLCQLIHKQVDKNLLEQTLQELLPAIQDKLRNKIEDIWASLPEHQEVENKDLLKADAVRAACNERNEILNRAILEFLKETFADFTEEQKRLVYYRVSDLADRTEAENSWGESHSEDNIIRLIDAVAIVLSELNRG